MVLIFLLPMQITFFSIVNLTFICKDEVPIFRKKIIGQLVDLELVLGKET